MMRSKIEEIIWMIRVWLDQQCDNDMQENNNRQRRRLLQQYFIVGVIPLVASFILVQLQQENEQNHQQHQTFFGLRIFVGVWRSVILGIASLILSVWHFCLRIVGISLGIGLGLGFAGHVYDALPEGGAQDGSTTTSVVGRRGAWKMAQSATSATAGDNNLPKADAMAKSSASGMMEDVNSYRSLMRCAGYSNGNGTLRAQMVRGDQASLAGRANDAKRRLKLLQFEQYQHPDDPQSSIDVQQRERLSVYKFDKGQTASMRMKCMWPNLAPVVNESLAKLIEFVLRDYVSSWYSKLDENVVYNAADLSSRNSSTTTTVESGSIMDGTDVSIQTEGDRRRKQYASSNPLQQDSPRSSHHLNSFGEDDDASSYQKKSQTLSHGSSSHTTLSNSVSSSSDRQQSTTQQQKRRQQQKRTMVLTTTGTQPSPFIDSLYSCFAYMLGILATRASENVNVLELLLLHFPHILGQNLRIYREMKNLALEKRLRRANTERELLMKDRNGGEIGETTRSQLSPLSSSKRSTSSVGASVNQQSLEVSEIAIVREYLLAGRFHRAVTFGLDVPSLLFADPLAKDCPPGPSYNGNSDCDRLNGNPDEDAILYDRLLSPESGLIGECEMDYIRVLASKLTKFVVPKTEVDSSIVRAMLVETLTSCVLGPVMGCFTPDNVNRWIVLGLSLLEGQGAEKVDSDSPTPSHSVEAARHSDGARKNSIETNTASVGVGSEGNDPSNLVDSVIEEMASGGSVASSDMDESLFGMNDEGTREKDVRQLIDCSKAEQIITLLSMSIIELGGFVDFCQARTHGQDNNADWDSQKCQDSVRHLVLVIEAALLFGARSHPKRQHSPEDRGFSEFEIEATLDQADDDEFEVDLDDGLIGTKVHSSVQHTHSSLSAALMEVTGDIDAFEGRVENVEECDDDYSSGNEQEIEIIIPKPNELSTLRTLIAAWLHTGQAFKVMSIVVQAKQTILRRFFHKNAFLRRENYARDFTKLLRQLDGVNILVDTMEVLESRCLLEESGFDDLMKRFRTQPKAHIRRSLRPSESGPKRQSSNSRLHSTGNSSSVVGSVKANLAHNRNLIARFAQSATEIDLNPFKDRNTGPSKSPLGSTTAYNHHQSSIGTPAYLAFSKNEVFASNLRSERERRYASWSKETKDRKKLDFVSRTTGMKDKDILMHRELHHLSRCFYSNSNEIRIEPCSSVDNQSISSSTANITIKGVGARRMIEVPEEDSSFLLRASSKPLKPKCIQPDRRNPNAVCKVYVALYEDPAIHPKTKRYYGGRYLRQCLMRYYPNDKTASVSVVKDIEMLDGRLHEGNPFVLTEDFQKVRHACLKVATGGILSSPLMEPSDFSSIPRTGRAIDFAHRISLFERPMVELGGKKFVIHDATSHRADASSLELSDASMTAAIILRGSGGLNVCDASGSFNIKVTDDGTPLILLRANREPGSTSKSTDEARPYRPSFIRAALLVKSAKHEARYQCILSCIRNGSARSSSKVKSDEWLQPTLTLLEYANSRQQEGQSTLQRDLRFGVNHIDRGQLRRNGLLNPRYPTVLRALNTKVEGVVEVKGSDFDILGSPSTLFRIRCTAIAEYKGDGDDDELTASSISAPSDEKNTIGSKSKFFREEWTVLRSLKDFTAFHKHIKSQVAPTEHSASTSAKLVGSVSAALTIVGGNSANARQRGPLVPSLAQVVSAGTFGLNVAKRIHLLDQYLKYLVSPKNLISRCPELLTFLGAYTPVFPLDGVDEYGRESITREELVTERLKVGIAQVKQGHESVSSASDSAITSTGEEKAAVPSPKEAGSMDDMLTASTVGKSTENHHEEIQPAAKKENQQNNHAAREVARLRAGEISLKDVRGSIFQLLKHLFDLDNASFFRSRVISVLKTMSVAVASVQYFQLMLFKVHVNYMNGEWISRWILYFVDMFWPNGVFYKREPPMNSEELLGLKRDSKKMLNKMFPDQLRKVLGRHTDEGLGMLHEMLQNRLVLKSMAYMLMDIVWVEIFPELSDFVTGAESLEKDT